MNVDKSITCERKIVVPNLCKNCALFFLKNVTGKSIEKSEEEKNDIINENKKKEW